EKGYEDKIRGIKLNAAEVVAIQRLSITSMDAINIINTSSNQQVNGSDCGYIVGLTLLEKALGQPLSIPNYTITSHQDYSRSIANARHRFLEKMASSQSLSPTDAYCWRLSVALAQSIPYDHVLRECIKLVPQLDDEHQNTVLKILKEIITNNMDTGATTSA